MECVTVPRAVVVVVDGDTRDLLKVHNYNAPYCSAK